MISSSIINNDILAPDNTEPYSFLEWIKRNNLINPDVNIQYANYKDYIIKWSDKKSLNKDISRETLLSSYVQVLREVVVSYSTEEERRFISNADLTNSSDVEIILPFFIEKLKQICLYYSIARENIKYTPIEYGIRGTNFGIEKVVKDLIFSTAQLDLSFDNLPVFFPPLSSIAQDLNVVVEELYDLKDDYFNKPPDHKPLVSNLQNLSTTNLIFPQLYVDFKQAIVDAINQYPFYLSSLGSIFSVNLSLSGNEVQYLKNRDFIDYLNNGANDNLKINLLRRLAPKYLANDFYYLSTGSTTTDIVSGLLFSVSPLTGAPTLNILNKKYPTVASTPSLDFIYTDYQIGRFFLPQNEGILTHIAPSKRFEISVNRLEPNKLYAFPDPRIIGNVSYNSGVEEDLIPLTYTVDVTWNKVSRSNQFKFGDVFAIPSNSLYYGYQSREQDLSLGTSGISRVQDNIDFWTGERGNLWKNSDIWPGLDRSNEYATASKQEILLINKGVPVYWASDVYNNEFCLFKSFDSLKTLSAEPVSQGVIPGQTTKLLPAPLQEEEKSIFEKKNNILGTLYFRDNLKNITFPAIEALSAVFLRYPTDVQNSTKAGFNYFAIYGNTIVAETSSYVVIDQFVYDYDNNQLKLATAQGLYFAKFHTNKKLERFAGEWFSEKEHKLYLCFLSLDTNYSKSSYKSLYPKIYSVDLNPLKSRVVYPKPTENILSIYSLSATEQENPQIDINKIDGISFEYLLKTNILNLTYLGKNLNGLPFFINEQIYKNEPFYYSYKPQLFQPFYFINDTNYYTPELPYFVKYSSSSTGIVGTQLIEPGRLVTSTYNVTGINYVFCDGLKPLQINNVGTYVVHFDWQTYTDVTMFIGCSSFVVRNVDNNLLWDAYTPNAKYLSLNDEYNTVVQKLSSPNTLLLNVNITKLVEDSSVVKFVVTSTTPSFTGLICDDFNSIYIPVTITKAGPGSGRIISEPFCIDCNEKCSELFGYNTTVTFIASADDYSIFERWEGGYCNLLRTDCIFTVTTAVNLTAYFGKLKIYDLIVTTPAGRVLSQDLRINADAGNGSSGPVTSRFRYPEGTIIALSAVQPISGWAMFGWEGGSCRGIQGDRCSFFIEENQNIFARYVRYYEYPLTISVQSFVQAQSASEDTIVVGADVVYDGVHTTNKFYATYECNRTCTYTFSGTNTPRYGNQFATLSAKPAPGRKLKYWQGDATCTDIEFVPVTDIISTIPVPEINRGYSCTLDMDRPRNVTGIFDLGYYTLTLQASGDGVGFVFTELPEPFFKNKIVAGDTIQYSVLSGTTLTIKCSAARGNTFLNLSSRYCPPVDGVSACQIFMDNDVTVISTITATAFYTLTIVNLGTCGIQVTAFPAGRFGTVIACPSGTGGCAAQYPANRTINIEPVSTNPTCGIKYFLNDPNIEENGGLKFRYQAGPGIFLSTITEDINIGDNLSLIDGSIRLTPGGAPFASGVGVTVEQKAYVLMTDNITVTAFGI